MLVYLILWPHLSQQLREVYKNGNVSIFLFFICCRHNPSAFEICWGVQFFPSRKNLIYLQGGTLRLGEVEKNGLFFHFPYFFYLLTKGQVK